MRKELDIHRNNTIRLGSLHPMYQYASKEYDRISEEIYFLEDTIYDKVRKLRESKNKEISIIKSQKNDEEENLKNQFFSNIEKNFPKEYLTQLISFKPIKIDLNNSKKVLKRYEVICINPKI